MEQIKLARLAVAAAPYLIDKPYTYTVPDALEPVLERGMRVLVPFGRGNRTSEAMVLSIENGAKRRGLKAIASILDDAPVLDAAGIRMALWMRERYFCTMYDAVRTILPTGLWFRTQTVYYLCDGVQREQALSESKTVSGAELLLDMLFARGGRAEEDVLKAACGPRTASALKALCAMGLVRCETESLRQIQDGRQKMLALTLPAEEAMAAVEGKQRSAPLRYEVVKLLSAVGSATQAEVCYFTGASASTIASLKKAGLITVYEEEKLRISHAYTGGAAPEIHLNEEQASAYEAISEQMDRGKASAVLLHGVTGSGKTQVYIRLAQKALSLGKSVIVLVPEIALTPQMMDKFGAYFGSRAVMLHSALRMTERYDQWKRIRRGEVSLVLGTRSAIFAPLPHLGLIILDEEQESSYQSENPPRYHAREVAQYLCAQNQATLVLGSATPSIETAYAAEQGLYRCIKLRQRYNRKALPEVMFADMKEELRCGNGGIISASLRTELKKNLDCGEQSILFLNRRGNSRMLLCGECGCVPQCPRCSVPMTYHSANGRLMCHYCGFSQRTETFCPECGGQMKHVGTGTQKAEEELKALFPNAAVLRMDADTVAVRGGHERILHEFKTRRVPILLGTQMVAKGLDFENVTLVGVLAADLTLYMDHYCAAERTFSLLTQVIGRAGRGEKGGRAVIQTYTPENEVLQCAAQQDYDRFYRSEIRMRRLHNNPPFADLFTLVVSGADEGRVLRASAVLRDAMKNALQNGLYQNEPIQVVGPAPAPVAKVNNCYRYHVYLVAKNHKTTRAFVEYYIKAFSASGENRGVHIFVNCNAMN